MSEPSRTTIRTRLRQAASQVTRRVVGRFAPIGDHYGPPPDHKAYLRPDYGMCCEYHDEHAFQPSARPLLGR
jgi:hypothetical protein